MYNYVMLIGVLESVKQRKTTFDEMNIKSNIVVAVQRPFKNIDGEYETDHFKVIVFGEILGNFLKNEMLGKKIAIGGRLAMKNGKQVIVGDKVIMVGANK